MAGSHLPACARLAGSWPECLDMLVPEIRVGGHDRAYRPRLVFEFAMDYGAMHATLM